MSVYFGAMGRLVPRVQTASDATAAATTIDDLANIVRTELQNGTWTNYTDSPLSGTDNPPTFVDFEHEITKGEEHIRVSEPKRKPIHALNLSTIYNDKSCLIRTYSRNTTYRDNIYKDIVAIFFASNYGLRVADVNERTPYQNFFVHELKVETIN